jgi:hypothetical protein
MGDAPSQALVDHYRKKRCTIYKHSPGGKGAQPRKGADFIIVCGTGDSQCIGLIEIKGRTRDSPHAMEQMKETVKNLAEKGYINTSGANPSVNLTIFNPPPEELKDTNKLGDVDVGTDKKKPKVVTKVEDLPC